VRIARLSQRPRQPHRVQDRIRERGPAGGRERRVEEGAVEARLVRDDDAVAEEVEQARSGLQ
jgi:hypothetical protein